MTDSPCQPWCGGPNADGDGTLFCSGECFMAAMQVDDDWQPKPRTEWDWTDYWTEAVCKTVGCSSWLSWRGFGYRFVCNPLHLWLWRRDDAKEARRG